ncbi:MAG: type 4a pilus biogenesis protein PilO [Candidatus Omnitrophica bacterium]|jgi:Tfp pilus assembly protein PilO|nr:type 4a pilus biogenesis protein PilO [Candidatus Omnitrophota bacterium]
MNKKLILIAIVAVFILYADYAFVLQPQLKNINDTGVKISKKKIDIDTLLKDLVKLQEAKRKAGETESSVLSKSKRILSDEDIPLLLNEISAIANICQIKIMQIKPVKEAVKEVKPVKVRPTKTRNFTAELITLELTGEYHNFGKFINILEGNEVFLAVDDFKISPISGNYLQQNIKMVLKTYVKE